MATLRVGLAGLGTVGLGVLKLLRSNADGVARRAGRRIEVVAVSARDRARDRGESLVGLTWYDDLVALARDPNVDVVVELIGGAEGPAASLVETALGLGKPVVTGNKALLAHHGDVLGRLARDHHTAIAFEAAVAGGIPVIKALREGLAANRINRISGILNGTCNYMLSKMRDTGAAFADVLAEAQELGYAEKPDPSLDIDGHDAAHKLAVLAAVAFDIPVDLDAVYVEGIRHISALDIEYAEELGYRIKLLGTAVRTERGIEQRVHPTMVPASEPIARVEGVENAVVIEGDAVGRIVLQGRGAGAGPTASAVVADLADIAQGRLTPSFLAAGGTLSAVSIGEHDGPCYVRLMVLDQPGVIADVAAELRNEKVSVEALIQRRHQPGSAVPVVLTTHPSQEASLARALARIAKLGSVVEPPRMIRIES